MKDFRDQLLSLREIVPAVSPAEARHQPMVGTGSVPIRPQEQRKKRRNSDSHSVPDLALARLATFGKVLRCVPQRGFGIVQHDGQDRFLHVLGHLFRRGLELAESDIGRAIVYLYGFAPRNGRMEIIQWCFADELNWPDATGPLTQESFSSIRSSWLKSQGAEKLFELVVARWHLSEWRKHTKVHINEAHFEDPLLFEVFCSYLNDASDEVLRSLPLKKLYADSPYSFAAEWSEEILRPPKQTLSGFSPRVLRHLGLPRAAWMPLVVDSAQMVKMAVWGISTAKDSMERERWRSYGSSAHGENGRFVVALINSGWTPEPDECAWLKQLINSGGLAALPILERIRSEPEQMHCWLEALPDRCISELIANGSWPPAIVADLAERAASPDVIYRALCDRTLSLDLETNGDEIWSLGFYFKGQRKLFNFGGDQATTLTSALEALDEALQASLLVVGHNLQRWDWPILRNRLPTRRGPVLWDTMLIQFMLEPWGQSFALGSSHRPDEDAEAAFTLFERQLRRCDRRVALQLLRQTVTDSSELIGAVAAALIQGKAGRVGPHWLEEARGRVTAEQCLVVSGNALRELDWCPRVCVIVAHQAPPAALLEIDVDVMCDALDGAVTRQPETIALLSALRWMRDAEITVRLGMLPLWLTKRDGLEQPLLQSLRPGTARANWLSVIEQPASARWLFEVDSGQIVLLDEPSPERVCTVERMGQSKLPVNFQREIMAGSTSESVDQAKRIGNRVGRLFPLDAASDVERRWAWFDSASWYLARFKRNWQVFSTVSVASKGFSTLRPRRSEHGASVKILKRDGALLYPGSEDQQIYWLQVLSAFAETTRSQQQEGVVHLLLVTSSLASELIDTLDVALAEAGLGEVAVRAGDDGGRIHSRTERLRRAAKHGWILVDQAAHWPAWLDAAATAEVRLLAVIEALPLHEWFAMAHTGANAASDEVAETSVGTPELIAGPPALGTGDADDEGEESEDEEDSLVEGGDVLSTESQAFMGADEALLGVEAEVSAQEFGVSAGKLAAETTNLAKRYLVDWINSCRLEEAAEVLIIDPRLSRHEHALQGILPIANWNPLSLSDDTKRALQSALSCFSIERETAPDDYASMERFLIRHWNTRYNKRTEPGEEGYIPGFRETTQRPVMEAVCDRGSDVLVTLPTGEGKSVLFQVPALCRGLRTRRLTLVISPLKALMSDQVEGLRTRGFSESVDYLTSDRPWHELDDVFQGLLDHRIVLLYVAPERLRSARFMDALNHRAEADGGFEYLVVDEAHCVSQWGYEFRPDYFHALKTLCESYRQATNGADRTPFLLLSATVTAPNRADLERLLAVGHQDEPYLPFVARPDAFFHPLRAHIVLEPMTVQGRVTRQKTKDWEIDPRLAIILSTLADARANRKKTGQHSSVIVFVSRRDHAEELSMLIRREGVEAVDFFHAGLDVDSRNDVYEGFKNQKIDVLVATKAFGMGMDIPHIHWAIHLSPPTYLEDYLQEVGRIGRDEEMRGKAKLDKLRAVLFHSPEDFDALRAQRAQSQIDFPEVLEFYNEILAAKKSIEGVAVAVVPDAGFKTHTTASKLRAACTRARLALHWLEQAGKTEIVNTVPGLLPVTLHLDPLRRTANSKRGQISELASALVRLAERGNTLRPELTNAATINAVPAPVETRSQPDDVGLIRSILKGLGSMIGMLFGSSATPPPVAVTSVQSRVDSPAAAAPLPTAVGGDIQSVINLGELWRETSIDKVDDALALVAELEKSGAVTVTRQVGFATRSLGTQPAQVAEQLFSMVEAAVEHVHRKLGAQGDWVLDFDELDLDTSQLTGLESGLIDQAHWGLRNALTYLLRGSGARVRQQISKTDEALETRVRLSASQVENARRRVKNILLVTRKLHAELSQRAQRREREIEVTRLVEVVRNAVHGSKYSEFRLRQGLGLLSTMRMFGISDQMVPVAYVVMLTEADVPLGETDRPEVWAELKNANRFSELRCFAMDVFANLMPEMRDAFLKDYFEAKTTQELEEFLYVQLGNVLIDEEDGTAAESFLARKRAELRAEAVGKFFSRYTEEPQEPDQWNAISHHYRRHLLVNAGPGSGKTSVLLGRVIHLIREQGLKPEQIQVLAFNRAVVHEIRARVKEMFTRLGYGTYVRRLNVHTFHGFALKHLELSDRSQWERLLPMFADRLATDSAFRLKVAGSLRALLVDEFQDANADIYEIIRQLWEGSQKLAGVMVIGDDDQDILRWNRDPRREFAQEYFESFQRDFANETCDQLVLRVNFRSDKRIVDSSQRFLNKFFEKDGRVSYRLKKDLLRSRDDSDDGQFIHRRVASLNDAVGEVARELGALRADATPKSLAVLGRTNVEVASAYQRLKSAWPGIVVQTSDRQRCPDLRHLGLWLDQLQQLSQQGNQPLSESLIKTVSAAYRTLIIPEVLSPRDEDITPESLIQMCRRESVMPRLSDLIELVSRLDTSEVARAGIVGRNAGDAVVSTIHKVKGLEFERVWILPSESEFKGDQENAVEETRLAYVGMTRAKHSMTLFFGEREDAFWDCESYRGKSSASRTISGTPEDVFISWAWLEIPNWNGDPEECQSYIEREVRVGDRITLGGSRTGPTKSLCHQGRNGRRRQVGALSGPPVTVSANAELSVSAVVRYPHDPAKLRGKYEHCRIAQPVLDRGWGYIVLVSGVL